MSKAGPLFYLWLYIYFYFAPRKVSGCIIVIIFKSYDSAFFNQVFDYWEIVGPCCKVQRGQTFSFTDIYICLFLNKQADRFKVAGAHSTVLFPTSIVEMYCPGLFVNFFINLEAADFCFLSISTFNLLADTNAISIPEKNAENNKDNNMTIKNPSIDSFVSWLTCWMN